MRVALVHDFLMQMGGAEKVLEALHDLYPDAPIYTSAYDPRAMPDAFRLWDIRTSFLQRLLMKRHTHRLALVLYPLAFESFALDSYDVVLSSSSAFAKGVITQPDTEHICYTHTPMRYAWAPSVYMKHERAGRPLRALLAPTLHYLRLWDWIAASRVDHYIANSTTVAQRIHKFYRRESQIIYPPVDTGRFRISGETGDYYIVVARFVPYKRIDLAIEAFTRIGLPLKVVGTGRQMKALRASAGANVEFLGHVGDTELPDLVARARAFILPGAEDFGIAAVEANACGTPVIAYAAGGALDTQIDGVTGVLFHEQSADALCDAIRCANHLAFDRRAMRAHAMRFDTTVFREEIRRFVNERAPIDPLRIVTRPAAVTQPEYQEANLHRDG